MPVPGKMCGAFAPQENYNTENRMSLRGAQGATKPPPGFRETASPTNGSQRHKCLHYCSLTIQLLLDTDHAFAQICLGFDLAGDLLNGIHYGRMVASAKDFADLR